jgi:hypothetical protein
MGLGEFLCLRREKCSIQSDMVKSCVDCNFSGWMAPSPFPGHFPTYFFFLPAKADIFTSFSIGPAREKLQSARLVGPVL